jgi:hypothetical protein
MFVLRPDSWPVGIPNPSHSASLRGLGTGSLAWPAEQWTGGAIYIYI